MPLCGSSRCSCALVSVPAASGEINGALPTIDVAGNGTPTSPWNLTLNDEWTAEVVADLAAQTGRMAVGLRRSTGLSIPNGAVTDIAWDVEGFDDSAMHTGSNATITIPVNGTGLWHVGYTVHWAAAEVSVRETWVVHSANAGRHIYSYNTTGSQYGYSGSTVLRATAADTFKVQAYQNSGGAINIQGDAFYIGVSSFWAYRLGD